MKFKMNEIKYEIKEVESNVMFEVSEQERPKGADRLGQHCPIEQTIYLNKKLSIEQKRRTLYHELMHCYIWSYMTDLETLNEEDVCNISANAHDIIHKIVEDYFRGK